ncbi:MULTISPECIES: hypothetical protein [unclassified Chelatococcus]|uniref:hypothetical protein n=1 Tax=unclassified Chelatococcus TaxID=2638111 RepID=UPI001BCAC392|nr:MULTISPECIES: hypothetical protein [unclassified Chelatococcus]MBS7700363.1 hypothetical protein [Chelatococcus sp. YT9]MBX3556159.1 hypothetical protein [Chelatococcus sp.]
MRDDRAVQVERSLPEGFAPFGNVVVHEGAACRLAVLGAFTADGGAGTVAGRGSRTGHLAAVAALEQYPDLLRIIIPRGDFDHLAAIASGADGHTDGRRLRASGYRR